MNDADVAATLRDIREAARAAARAAVVEHANEPAPQAASAAPRAAPAPVAAGGSRPARAIRRLVRPVLVRAATWMSRAILERLAGIEGSLGHAIGELRSVVAGHEQRVRQLEDEQVRLRQLVLNAVHQSEDEQVRLRQMVLQLEEAAQLADRSRRGALLRIEELEARLGDQEALARRSTA